VLGGGGSVVLPTQKQSSGAIIGVYRHNRKGFGFVEPRDPGSHEDLYIPAGENGGAINGDIVSAKITNSRRGSEGKTLYEGRVIEILERTQKKFVGTLVKQHGEWLVLPDGKSFTEPIFAPDAASRHVKPGTKVVIELTTYPGEDQQKASGVITEILGKAGEKDVDLRSVIVQFNLPADFPVEVKNQAREAIDRFNSAKHWPGRMDLSDEVICTIDPDDAKDYDDAISLKQLDHGQWELGVHIADVSFFVPSGTPLDEEAQKRGNSCYFPGHVIPMLPEILSNGVCSLQEGVPRLCKSAFITFDEDGRPIRTRFANTVINSAKRLRYREAQAIIDKAQVIPHPEGARRLTDYPEEVVDLLEQMNALARRIQRRRLEEGQIVLELPEVELVLDEEGKVVGTQKEDTSFTHTLIEMFMVEANEAVARLFDSMNLPFMRRIHPEPEPDSSERLRHFVQVAGYKLPKDLNRKAIQYLLGSVRGKPESFAINLAVLKSLARAEYSPEPIGHYALASEHYCHFTSPIRRYADLMVHRLLDSYFAASGDGGGGGRKGKKQRAQMENVISFEDLQETGRHISFTERRADDAERELRQVKILELLKDRVGEQFVGVVTGITNFGIFVQISEYLIDGLIRYEDLMDDWWDVDERSGQVRGQRTGTKIGIGDVVRVTVVNVDVPRRELNLAVAELMARAGRPAQDEQKGKQAKAREKNRFGKDGRGGGPRSQGGRQGHRKGGNFSRRRRGR
jgi:ribonuclease R